MTDLEALGRAVKQVQWRNHRALDTQLASIGSSLAQWDALRAVSNHPGASAHDLAVATFQSDQSFATLARRLLAQGVVQRLPGRGRRIEHHLTPEGARVLAAGAVLVAEVQAETFAPLSAEDRQTLLRLLTTMID